MKSTSASNHSFAQVPSANIQRSSFNRSHGFKTTFNSGFLVPIFVDEVLPGDTFNLSMSTFARLATPIKPFMDNLFFETFFFFVPNRLLWQHWEQFCGYQANPGDSTSYLIPQVPAPATSPNPGGSPATVPGWPVLSLQDYFGIPTNVTGFSVNNLHGRAYNLIWNEWFRDENLQSSVVVDQGDGPDTASNYVLLRRGKRHDYFTSALPFAQKGVAVTLPLGTAANVKTSSSATISGAYPPLTMAFQTGTYPGSNYSVSVSNTTGDLYAESNAPGSAAGNLYPTNLYADLSTATAATINQLRQAASIQQLYERDARGGTRYTEIVLSHFRVKSPDARLQRPEYLGGGSTRININPIAQTSNTPTSGTPQGNLAAMGTLSSHGHGFVKSFTEHGVILGLCSVRADLNYQQGLNKMWTRQTRFDFFWPDLAMMGEQAVLNSEIYLQGNSTDALVFGYQERYAEYRYKPSLITGEFRSTYSQPLDFWHLAEYYTSLPTLGPTWIQTNPPLARVLADTVDPQFLLDTYSNLVCARPMPVYGVPGLTRF